MLTPMKTITRTKPPAATGVNRKLKKEHAYQAYPSTQNCINWLQAQKEDPLKVLFFETKKNGNANGKPMDRSTGVFVAAQECSDYVRITGLTSFECLKLAKNYVNPERARRAIGREPSRKYLTESDWDEFGPDVCAMLIEERASGKTFADFAVSAGVPLGWILSVWGKYGDRAAYHEASNAFLDARLADCDALVDAAEDEFALKKLQAKISFQIIREKTAAIVRERHDAARRDAAKIGADAGGATINVQFNMPAVLDHERGVEPKKILPVNRKTFTQLADRAASSK